MTLNSKKFFLCTAFSLLFLNAFAQWEIFTKKFEKKVIYDVLSAYRPAEFTGGYTFFGPTATLNENIVSKGLELGDKEVTKPATGVLQKAFLLKNIPVVNIKTDAVYLNICTDNIKAYNISIEDKTGHKYNKEYTIADDGYQVPVQNLLSDFRKLSTDEIKSFPNSDYLQFEKLTFTLTKRDAKRSAKFTIGECAFLKDSVMDVPARGYFFYQVTGNDQNKANNYTTDNVGNSYPILSFTIFRDLNSQAFSFIPKTKEDDKLKDQTLQLIKFIISKYPYYNERRINKDQIDHCLDSVISSKHGFNQKLAYIDSLVNNFSDGHFYFEKKQIPVLSGPVFIKEIGGELLITGVLDPKLKEQLNLGAIVTKVDNVPVNKLIDSLMRLRHYGQSTDRRNQVISRLLYKTVSDSTLITVTDQGKEKSAKWFYNKKVVIPSNFKPVDQDFKIYNNWAYYRLNVWGAGDWITFYNHRDQLKKSKGVIFDLRGNSGGLEVEAYKIFSCFLERSTTVTHSMYAFDDSKSVHGSNIALPNAYLNLSKKPVIILIDNKTACASEIFISVMKNNCHALIVGNERTSGAYASGEYFYLPYNIVFKTNVLNKFYPPGEENSIEFKGLEPDVYVPFYSYKDLYPYEDKVMQMALRIAEAGQKATYP
ncbi:S41 family peptidase [Mucilaginibacter sp. KACC 22063]|uniref:S41 family peptidase n=1 Tax=Mucilaginibacter sp. KACC 22063 TaxID=3025666 RepID=UPI002366D309|nr:S41 family peptidase [Mucilaginibacter sp. KACC 22063]WDF56222.1 S41 family peptidase [Mucilaginibacter sp. KACC 22063]